MPAHIGRNGRDVAGRISEQLVVGAGVGYGRDATDIGIDGSNSRSNSTAIAVYGSYQPTPNTYIDGVLGYGRLNFSSERFVTPVSDFARSQIVPTRGLPARTRSSGDSMPWSTAFRIM